MKVSSIKNAFHTMVEDFSATKSQKLNKLTKTRVQIHSGGMSKDVLEQLETAKKTLGNYAHAKDVYISIGAAKPNKNDNNSHKNLYLWVTDRINNKATNAIIDADTKKLHEYKEIGHRMYETSDETQVMKRYIKEAHEDNFLRNLYRYVETMVEQLHH